MIRQGLSTFAFNVTETFALDEGNINILNQKVDYLSKALDRLTKFDWNSIALTTIISISIALSLDTTKGKLLFDMFRLAVHKIIELIAH